MLFRTLTKARFRDLVERFISEHEVIGPRRVCVDREGTPVHQLLPVSRFEDLELDYEYAEFSAKTYFLPYEEQLSSFELGEWDWSQKIRYRVQPRAIIGLRACDINALVRLDKVFARNLFPSPYYLARRKNTFIVGLDHDPCDGGFCRSVDSDTVSHGFDLFLTDLGDRYFAAINSDRAFSALRQVGAQEITDEDTNDYLAARQKIGDGFGPEVNVHNLANLLDIEFDSPVWQRWGDKCMSCGTCAMVCPTCYCYGVHEEVGMDFCSATKTKKLHSCNLLDFAEVAGGHNFRPDRQTRLKYRYYHQHRGFVEAHESALCVGCNRCGRACLAGINPREIIADLQEEGPPVGPGLEARAATGEETP